MSFILQPWHIVLLAISAMIDGERDKAIEYLLMENQVPREKLGKGRILLNDAHRCSGGVKKCYELILSIVSRINCLLWMEHYNQFVVYLNITPHIVIWSNHRSATIIKSSTHRNSTTLHHEDIYVQKIVITTRDNFGTYCLRTAQD